MLWFTSTRASPTPEEAARALKDAERSSRMQSYIREGQDYIGRIGRKEIPSDDSLDDEEDEHEDDSPRMPNRKPESLQVSLLLQLSVRLSGPCPADPNIWTRP